MFRVRKFIFCVQEEYMEKELPVRKKIRLDGYDYSQAGYYFITMCIEGKHEMLGQIVGRGILDAPFVELTEYGNNVVEAIKFLNNKNQNINIEKYVIMPNHVHMIIVIQNEPNAMVDSGGACLGSRALRMRLFQNTSRP